MGTWGEEKAPWGDVSWSKFQVVDEPLIWENGEQAYSLANPPPDAPTRLANLRHAFLGAEARGKRT